MISLEEIIQDFEGRLAKLESDSPMNLILVTHEVKKQKFHSFINPQQIISIEMDAVDPNRSWLYLTDGRQLKVCSHYSDLRNLALGKLGMPFKRDEEDGE